jgi:hypothetical protein
MYVTGVSAVDHAYIDVNGNLMGGTINPTFLLEGALDKRENVLVDFSTCKKQIKACLDDRDNGFDHKLWILENSGCIVEQGKGDTVRVLSDTLDLYLPSNAIKFIPEVSTYSASLIQNHLTKVVQALFDKSNKDQGFKVKCYYQDTPTLADPNSEYATFTYCHGLRDSTSWGCQNIAHGHLSYIQLLNGKQSLNWLNHLEGPVTPKDTEVSPWLGSEQQSLRIEIANFLDRSIFVWADNIEHQSADGVMVIYESRDRGEFSLYLDKSRCKVVVTEEETTVENLAVHVAKHFYHQLVSVDIRTIVLSEGLCKGSYVDLEDLK